ncbi:DUF1353 domain-containing protein [Arthrobacter sp. I2-34]|uniref:DUF1353 domain-containing protein n=1 Tax=Arthrobacter hankyongi TaxID=2904801 RepID=A0ABS9L216_9MICC|nr:DUF1353 domain-containing protein [Arthrobacter hankyongi]MCG2620701.1 DUF1353 domain-containing protein [Arthrobacter hankyongi]
MPFHQDAAATQPLTAIHLVQRTRRLFQLAEPIYYSHPDGTGVVTVHAHDLARGPAGNSSDLASVPTFMWGLVASYGRQSAPALLHDQRMTETALLPAAAALAQRRIFDEEFRLALLDTGVAQLRARLMWAAVSAQNQWMHTRLRGKLMAACIAAGALALAAGILLWATTGNPLSAAVALAAAAAVSALWARDWAVVAVLAAATCLLGPVLLATWVGQLLLWVCESLWWLAAAAVSRRPAPPPVPGPLARIREL